MENWENLLNNLSRRSVSIVTNPINGNVPHLGFLYHLASSNKLCSMYLKKVQGSVNDKIERIGKAVLKQTWKSTLGVRRGSGTNFHTWPLGLPRQSSLKCVCHQNDRRTKKEVYGYRLLPSRSIDNFCEQSKRCGGAGAGDREARRTSMIHLMPVKEGVLILPLFANDLKMLIDGSKKFKLYHVGGHFVRGQKPMPCCNRHFVSVNFILNNRSIPSPQKRAKGCGCGTDPGGIATTRKSVFKLNLGTDPYARVLEAALNWVYEML